MWHWWFWKPRMHSQEMLFPKFMKTPLQVSGRQPKQGTQIVASHRKGSHKEMPSLRTPSHLRALRWRKLFTGGAWPVASCYKAAWGDAAETPREGASRGCRLARTEANPARPAGAWPEGRPGPGREKRFLRPGLRRALRRALHPPSICSWRRNS